MKTIPSDGLTGLRENWRQDLVSGFLVFLIALPLCLGIAMASGFPPIGGIITAIIGGMIVGPVMGSRLSIKGPAAGLIAIAVAAVAELGQGDPLAGYRLVLAVIVAAGVLQVLFGLLRLGRFVDFFPSAAVHGMLAAIGIIIIAKQVPVLLGVKPAHSTPLALLAEIPSMITALNPEIALIGGSALLILFGLPLIKASWARKVPGPMLVLLIAMPLGRWFDLDHEHSYLFLDHTYSIGPGFLVTLPSKITDGITFPDFSQLLTWTSFKYILMFALVGSLESLLTVKAIDGLDPYMRKSDANRDLLAVGAGNTLAGMIGGLPMIAEVVRSSANVNNGARTRWANFFHGTFLLVFVAFFPALIHQIPLSALAAMLIYTGYRLASPGLFRKTYKIGKEQIAVFLVTIVVTLAEDLLLGIAAGILVELLFHLFGGAPLTTLFRSIVSKEENGEQVLIRPENAAVFTNYLGFKKYIETLPAGKDVVIDFSGSVMVDHTFMEQLHHFEERYHRAGGSVRIEGLDHLHPVSTHPLAARRLLRRVSAGRRTRPDKRQRELALLARQQQYSFVHQPVTATVKYRAFALLQPAPRVDELNLVSGYTDKYRIELADIHIFADSSHDFPAQKMTALVVSDLQAGIPEFSIFPQAEEVDDASTGGFYPEARQNKITGINDFYIESAGGKIIFFLRRELLSAPEIKQLLSGAKDWLTYVEQV